MMKLGLLKKPSIAGDGLRFVFLGGVNTGITLVIYQLLLFALPPLPAYYASWAIGLMALIFAFPSYVFKGSHGGLWRVIATIGIYMTSLTLGGLLLTRTKALGIEPQFGIFFVIGLTMFFNFATSRLVFRYSSLFTSRSRD